ncbi:MAG: FAD-binding protein [Deltaproteobacteria bacterium]|nr:FAD-binding protein [Deltaproteobacteria bacterium]
MQTFPCDVLIIGSGIAGLRAALEVSRRGRQALLVSKSPLGKATNTYLAGGFFHFGSDAAAVAGHVERTLHSGRGLNRRDMVEGFAREAPSMVRELQGMGVPGAFHPSGFSAKHTSFLGGPVISLTLLRGCREAGVLSREGVLITDLVVGEERCLGAIGIQKDSGEILGFPAGAVLLATGGAGSIYAQNNNAPAMMGAGYVLAMDAGLDLMDMEFVQFYPLGCFRKGQARMIVPTGFADLGSFTNRRGEDIKAKYALTERPVAITSRDRLSRALFTEIKEGRGVEGGILLDMRQVPDSAIPFPEEVKNSLKRNLSYHSTPIPIAPTCHYFMGGLNTDTSGMTSLKGLYAAGEVVGGIHGANRMGGNALSESLVFGARAARAAMEAAGEKPHPKIFGELAGHRVRDRFESSGTRHASPGQVPALMKKIGRALWEKAGILRDGASLKESIALIDSVLDSLRCRPEGSPREFTAFLECRNAALTARAVAVSALKRTESRGAHYRTDFPEESDTWLKHIHVRLVNGLPEVACVTELR